MKLTFEIDCTPQEARNLMGLPDGAMFQQMMMPAVLQAMQSASSAPPMEAFFKTWMTSPLQSAETWQKMLTASFADGIHGASDVKP